MTTQIDHTAALTTLLPLGDGTWRVDPQHSEIGFAAKSLWGLVTVRGSFVDFDASLRAQAGEITGELTIDANSVNTNNKKRDAHLRSSDFFDVEHHPQILFALRMITPGEGGRVTFAGDLSIGSARTRLEVPLSVEHTVDGMLRLDGQAAVSRKATGVTWNRLGTVSDEVLVHAHLTLLKSAGTPKHINGPYGPDRVQ